MVSSPEGNVRVYKSPNELESFPRAICLLVQIPSTQHSGKEEGRGEEGRGEGQIAVHHRRRMERWMNDRWDIHHGQTDG